MTKVVPESDRAPSHQEDPEGYFLWCQLHPCPDCDGFGDNDRFICRSCNGTGVALEEWEE